MSRPVIGITCYVEPARFTVWDVPAALLPMVYVDRVAEAGGQPVLLPPVGDPAPLVERLDGLIVAGGGDVDPARYGEPPHPAVSHVRGFRDEAEFALVAAAGAARLPLLGVCRGMQVLNVHRGGTLHRHLPEVYGHTGHSPRPGEYGRLPVRVAPDSRIAAALGRTEVTPAHYHHQGVDRLGEGLRAVARAEDGCVEAVEGTGEPYVLGVQWHPEVDPDAGLFAGFVDACRGA